MSYISMHPDIIEKGVGYMSLMIIVKKKVLFPLENKTGTKKWKSVCGS